RRPGDAGQPLRERHAVPDRRDEGVLLLLGGASALELGGFSCVPPAASAMPAAIQRSATSASTSTSSPTLAAFPTSASLIATLSVTLTFFCSAGFREPSGRRSLGSGSRG